MSFVTTSKSAAAYTKMFKILRKELEEAGIDVNKLTFMTDYERAAIKAIEDVSFKQNKTILFRSFLIVSTKAVCFTGLLLSIELNLVH